MSDPADKRRLEEELEEILREQGEPPPRRHPRQRSPSWRIPAEWESPLRLLLRAFLIALLLGVAFRLLGPGGLRLALPVGLVLLALYAASLLLRDGGQRG